MWLQWLNASSSFGWNETGESNRDWEGESLLHLHLASAHWPYPKFSTQKNNATLPPNRLVIRLIPLMPSLIHSGLLCKMEMERRRERYGKACGERGRKRKYWLSGHVFWGICVVSFSLSLSLYCDGAVSLSSLVRVANEIGLAGLHRAKALCLVSLGETAVAPPSEREGRMEKEEGVCRAEEGKERLFWEWRW